MFLLMLHYVLICLLDHLFVDDGATFCFNFLIFTVNVFFSIVIYCMGFEPAIECE